MSDLSLSALDKVNQLLNLVWEEVTETRKDLGGDASALLGLGGLELFLLDSLLSFQKQMWWELRVLGRAVVPLLPATPPLLEVSPSTAFLPAVVLP
jgi:hypothetical protein